MRELETQRRLCAWLRYLIPHLAPQPPPSLNSGHGQSWLTCPARYSLLTGAEASLPSLEISSSLDRQMTSRSFALMLPIKAADRGPQAGNTPVCQRVCPPLRAALAEVGRERRRASIAQAAFVEAGYPALPIEGQDGVVSDLTPCAVRSETVLGTRYDSMPLKRRMCGPVKHREQGRLSTSPSRRCPPA